MSFFVAVSVLLCFIVPAYAETATTSNQSVFDQSTHDSTGYGTQAARVDSQITLKIPAGKAQEVYAYLRANYVDKHELLSKAFPGLELYGQQRVDVSNFTDEYFDTPNLDLFKSQNSARHRGRVNTTDPSDRKNGRELVQIKVTPPGKFEQRTELKFDVQDHIKNETKDDSHPLIKLVKTKLREDFKNAFTAMGIDPYTLRHILTNHQQRSRVYINLKDQNILSFSVDEFGTQVLWAKAAASSVDVGLVENVYTAAEPKTREELGAIRQFMVDDLTQHFPELTQNSEEKYSILLKQIESEIPFYQTLIKYRII